MNDRNWRRLRSRGLFPPSFRSGYKAATSVRNGRSLLRGLAEFSALVAVLGGVTYVLGLFTLWVPIARAYTHDVHTAWYAASLVPRTIVAVLGVGQLLTYTFAYFALLVFSLSVGVFNWAYSASGGKNIWQVLAGLAALLLVLVPVLSWIPYLYGVVTGRELFGGGAFHTRIDFLPMVHHPYRWSIAVLALLIVCYSAVQGGTRMSAALRFRVGSVLPKVFNNALFVRGLVIFLGGLFLAAFLHATMLANPELPHVEVTGGRQIQGELLAHTEGFWYVFDHDGDLIAIPDAEVVTVRVSSPAPDEPRRGFWSRLFGA